MTQAWNDLRHGARMLANSPGFTMVALLTLALGIGANTAIFSLVNAVLLRPLPVATPSELVYIFTSDFSGPLYGASSYPDYREMRTNAAEVFSGLLAYTVAPVNLRSGERTERVIAELASEDYFQVLRINAALGRVFTREEGRAGAAAQVVMLGHGYWKRRFGGDPSIIGRSVTINGKPFTVVGVTPERFNGMTRLIGIDVWAPLPALHTGLDERGSRGFFLIGRLRPGKTVDEAQARLEVLRAQFHRAYPESWTDLKRQPRRLTAVAESGARVPVSTRAPILGFFALLSAVVGLVLVIACANIASLLLARAASRQREMSVRLAIGANRGRLVRQLLTENAVLSLAGGLAGLVLALWLNALLMAFKPPLPVSIDLDLRLDARVLGFATVVSFLSSLLFGLAPAWQATRTDIVSSLKESMPGGVPRRFGLRNILVVAQIAVSAVLLVGAGLFVRSLQNAYSMDSGYRVQNMLLLSVDMKQPGYSQEKVRQLQGEFLERVRRLPGVQDAEFAGVAALGLEARQRRGFRIEGYTPGAGEDLELYFNVIGPRYLETMGVPIVMGRGYTEEDREGAPLVAVVNEAFARRYWPDQDPIGKHIQAGNAERQVIGVARNAKYISLGEEPRPYVYLPLLQSYQPEATLHIRTAGDPGALTGPVRKEAEAMDKELPLTGIKSLSEHLGVTLLPVRAAAALLSSFGLLALLLAATGLYGVIAYSVTQRTREIGVRMALGARRADVLQMVVTQSLALALTGILVGLAGAAGVTRFVRSMLFDVKSLDPVTFSGAAAILVVVAVVACGGPGLRAARVDPMVALRDE